MPWWNGGSDFRRFTSFILARRQDCLLSRWWADCSWGDKWRDVDWSPSWWLRSQLPSFLGLEPRWIFSFETPWIISREADALLHTFTGLRSNSNWWSLVLDVPGSSSSTCHKKKSQNTKSNPPQLSICAKRWKKKMDSPDHGNTQEAPVQICEYIIPTPPRDTKAFGYSWETGTQDKKYWISL